MNPILRAWEARDDEGRTVRVFPLTDYAGETRGEKSKNAQRDAKLQTSASTRFVPLYEIPISELNEPTKGKLSCE